MLKARLGLMLGIGAISVGLGLSGAQPASAKYQGHATTPTELRGTWYQYFGHHRWQALKITKHAVSMNGKRLYATNKHGWRKLHVLRLKKGQGAESGYKGYGGTNYNLNSLAKYDYQTLGNVWLSHKRVHGKRTLGIYYNMGGFQVWTKQKLAHNYSYTYKGKQYLNRIGR
ncbi:hypothetical protein H3M12_03640 [Levilactobacillus suantsaii]|uniref:hypothetical protein n=1 Tax=Levilactobacillus suantsaii TaxID=2292255 RepID=UPI0015F3AC39|nr:hypothetical protein [Levilactobacillus suantsaii]QMU08763.1 hypothetical protein H3M12_03640 [Levilactobacillus suantsaii]